MSEVVAFADEDRERGQFLGVMVGVGVYAKEEEPTSVALSPNEGDVNLLSRGP